MQSSIHLSGTFYRIKKSKAILELLRKKGGELKGFLMKALAKMMKKTISLKIYLFVNFS